MQRYEEITYLLLEYAQGNYEAQGEITGEFDDLDAIISGINMLGEELRDKTVSIDYFLSVYNGISPMLFVLDLNGIITNINESVRRKLYTKKSLLGVPMIDLIAKSDTNAYLKCLKKLATSKKRNVSYEGSSFIKNSDKVYYNTLSYIKSSNDKITGILFESNDISEIKNAERQLLVAINKTRENEQKRVAEDLHDSLGQQLSAVKMYLNALEANGKLSPEQASLFHTTKQLVDTAVANIRTICFNLLPGTLEVGDLREALDFMVKRMNLPESIRINLFISKLIPALNKDFELALYRTCQEFINNTIKHADASEININIKMRMNAVYLKIEDNGKGFNRDLIPKSEIRGLNNMESRIKAFGGRCSIKGLEGKGTKLIASIPVKDNLL